MCICETIRTIQISDSISTPNLLMTRYALQATPPSVSVPTRGNHWNSSSLNISLHFSRTSYKRDINSSQRGDAMLCAAFSLASFTGHNYFEIHPVVACANSPFFFTAAYYFTVWIYHHLFIQSPTANIWAVSNFVLLQINLPWTSVFRILYKPKFSFLLRVEWLNHKIGLHLP